MRFISPVFGGKKAINLERLECPLLFRSKQRTVGRLARRERLGDG